MLGRRLPIRMLLGIQKVFSLRTFLVSAVLVVVARPAVADVMDKELSRSDIAHALLLALALALGAAALHRWLLLPLFLLGPVQEVGCAWTEWHDPFVGPAISDESGPAYGVIADGAMTIAVAAHLVLWFLSSRFRHRSFSTSQDALFAIGVLVAVFSHAALAFTFTWRSAFSGPMVVAGIAVFLACRRWRSERLAVPK